MKWPKGLIMIKNIQKQDMFHFSKVTKEQKKKNIVQKLIIYNCCKMRMDSLAPLSPTVKLKFLDAGATILLICNLESAQQ